MIVIIIITITIITITVIVVVIIITVIVVVIILSIRSSNPSPSTLPSSMGMLTATVPTYDLLGSKHELNRARGLPTEALYEASLSMSQSSARA